MVGVHRENGTATSHDEKNIDGVVHGIQKVESKDHQSAEQKSLEGENSSGDEPDRMEVLLNKVLKKFEPKTIEF